MPPARRAGAVLVLRGEGGKRRRISVDGSLARPPRLYALLSEKLLQGLRGFRLASQGELELRVLLRDSGPDGLGLIRGLPARGKVELELEVGVEKGLFP